MVSEFFVNELIEECHLRIKNNPEKALEIANGLLDLLDREQVASDTPQVIVDKARAAKDRAELATLFQKANPVKDDGLLDLERIWFSR